MKLNIIFSVKSVLTSFTLAFIFSVCFASNAFATNETWKRPLYDYRCRNNQPNGTANWSSPPGLAWKEQIDATAPSSVKLADVNGDGENDIVAVVAGGVSGQVIGDF